MINKIRLLIGSCITIYLFFFIACNSNVQKIEGLYVGKNFTMNIDSIQIMSNGIYNRIIYDNEGKLIFKNKSTYKMHDSHIEFNNFLLNTNDLKVRDSLEYNSDDLTNASLNLDVNLLEETKLFVDYDLDYYYLKIK